MRPGNSQKTADLGIGLIWDHSWVYLKMHSWLCVFPGSKDHHLGRTGLHSLYACCTSSPWNQARQINKKPYELKTTTSNSRIGATGWWLSSTLVASTLLEPHQLQDACYKRLMGHVVMTCHSTNHRVYPWDYPQMNQRTPEKKEAISIYFLNFEVTPLTIMNQLADQLIH